MRGPEGAHWPEHGGKENGPGTYCRGRRNLKPCLSCARTLAFLQDMQ